MPMPMDRKLCVDILFQGKADIGGALLPPPAGVWGLPPDILKTMPGYGPDVKKKRAEARKLMEKAGYGSDKRIKIKETTRNLTIYREPSVIVIDQTKIIYIYAELQTVE